MLKKIFEAFLLTAGLLLALLLVTWTWINAAPQSFYGWINWLTGVQVNVASMGWSRQWSTPAVVLNGVQLEHIDFTFSAQQIILRPSWFNEKTSRLEVRQWALRIKQAETSSPFDLKAALSRLNFHAPRIWLPLGQLHMEQGVVQFENWRFNLPRIMWQSHGAVVKARTLLMALYENTPIWAGRVEFIGQRDLLQRIQSGTLSLKTLQPMPLKNFAQLLETRWKKGVLRFDAAARFRDGQPHVTVNMLLEHLGIPAGQGKRLNSVGAQLNWQPAAPDVWKFTLAQWQLNHQPLNQQTPVTVTLVGQQLHIKAEHLVLSPFRKTLASLWPQWDWAHTQFQVQNVELKFELSPFQLVWAKGEVNRLGLPERTWTPGVEIQAARISTQDQKILIALPNPVQLFWKAFEHKKPLDIVFDAPLTLHRLQRGYWSLKPAQFLVDGKIPGKVRLVGDIAKGEFQFTLKPGTVAVAKNYIPYGLMSQHLQTWLKKALVKGRLSPVNISFSGPWKNIVTPGKTNLIAETQLTDASLRFQPAWPLLQLKQGELVFQPFELNVKVMAARIGDVHIPIAQAKIGSLEQPNIALEVTGAAQGSSEAVAELLMGTPLGERFKLHQVFETVTLQGGKIKSKLNLWMPLYGYEHHALKVDLNAQLSGVSALLAGRQKIEALTGMVQFNPQKRLIAHMEGRLFNQPLKLSVKTDTGLQRYVANIKAAVPLENYIAQVRGVLPVAGRVDIPYSITKTPVQFKVTAKAKVEENQLPEPLHTLIEAPMVVTGQVASHQVVWRSNTGGTLVSYGKFDVTKKKTQRLIVLLNQNKQVLSNYHKYGGQGIVLLANLESLRLGLLKKWWLAQNQKMSLSHSEEIAHFNGAINVKKLYFNKYVFNELSFAAYSVEHGRIGFNARFKEGNLSGIYYPDNHQVAMQTHRLHIAFSDELESESCEVWERPEDLKIFFVGSDIKIGSYAFESMRFNLYSDPAQIRVEGIQFSGKKGAVKGNGKYHWDFQKKLNTFKGHISARPAEDFLSWAGYSDSGFTGDKAVTDFIFNWSGAPSCFSIKKIQGKVEFRLDEGVVKQADSGLAKIISLLSVDSILRNIRVTLKNLQYAGLAYDKIEGKAEIRHGWASLKRFYLDAPSVAVHMKGGIDLMRRKLDLKANVSPRLMGSLTTLLAVFGIANPVTAIGTYVFLKNTTNLDDGLITYHYRVVGDWTSPKLINLDDSNSIKRDSVEELLDDD